MAPIHLRPCLEFCHKWMSPAAQKVEANISSKGMKEECSVKDPKCPHPTLRWLVGAAGGSGSHSLCSGPGDVPSLLAKMVSPIYGHHGQAPQRETEGRKWLSSMKISHVDSSQPFPVSTLPACCSRDALVSLGFGQAGDMPPALLSPSLPLSQFHGTFGLCHVPGTGGVFGVSDSRGW